MKAFQRLKTKLNPEQRLAVETIEGPVMVLAGPGTGKTQVVALRIAEILSRTQVGARNILALTFTEAGVQALRTRLEAIIGPDAYQVTVSTFHGFANEVIGTFPYLFDLDETARQLNDLERILILERIVIEETNLQLLRPIKQPTAHVSAIGQAIKTCKQEAVSPTQLKKLAQAELKVLTVAKKLPKLERQRRELQAKKNWELARVFERYQTELQAASRYDYEDMILLVVAALKSNDELRLHYQERYQYLLVDEYQDTNNSQNALVETIADFFVHPNLFVVGDDKQAIYRFQGASVANMLHFTTKYPAIKIIALNQNYRSTPEILQTATDLISHNQHQLTAFIPSIKTALETARKPGPEPVLAACSTPQAQAMFLVEKIKDLQQRGVPFNEIAVLFRLNAEVREFRRFAEKNDLPISGTLTTNLIYEPEIQLLLTLLQAIDNPQDEISLLPALRSLIEPEDLVDLLTAAQAQRGQLLRQFLAISNPHIRAAAKKLLSLSQTAPKTTLTEFLEIIIPESNILEAIRSRAERLEGLELIAAFFDEANRFNERQPAAKLKDFLTHFNLLRRYHVALNVNRILPEQNGLFIATVHAAKGLEFSAVLLPNVDELSWSTKHNRSLITLPSEIVNLKNWADNLEEDDRRVFYVGLTRAKNELYLSYSTMTAEGRPVLPCRFVAEVKNNLTEISYQPRAAAVEKMYGTALVAPAAPTLAARELAYIREQVKNTPFSFTDLKTYQLCPKQYLLRCVFKLPSEPTVPLIYGTAVHRALELFFRSYRATKKLPSLSQLLVYFNQALNAQPVTNDREQIRSHGRQVLSAYYERYEVSWVMPVGVEYSFRSHRVTLEDIWLSGKFDRIDPLDPIAQTVRVVDYKTVSRAPSRREIEGQTKNRDNSLQQQLIFYALLAERDRLFPYRPSVFSLSFIDDKRVFKEEDFQITHDQTKALAAEITVAYQEILTRPTFCHSRETYDQGCEICAAFPTLGA